MQKPSDRYKNYGVSESFPLAYGMRGQVYRDRVTGRISGEILVSDPASAYRYWALRLDRNGYTIEDSDFLDGYGHIRAHGHGCRTAYGDSTVRLTFVDTARVLYACES